MTAAFLKLVNMSLSAFWPVAAVLALRLVLRRSPKWIRVLMWSVVALRLSCPVPMESAVSLLPSAEVLPTEVLSGPTFTVSTGVTPLDTQVNEYLNDHYYEGMTVPFDNGKQVMNTLAVVWLAGVFVMLAYTALSYWRLRKKVAAAVLLRDNIFQSEYIAFPFVLGIIRPRIYLPFRMDEAAQEYVLRHEAAHIRRGDHYWKMIGFLILSLHWFNPVIWLSYALFCRDIELSCDERVIRKLDNGQRANYTEALVACSVSRRTLAACPLAFGEVGVRERVKAVLKYRKSAPWLICLALLLSTAAAACFLTDPKTEIVLPRYARPGDSWTEEYSFEGVLGCDGKSVRVYEMRSENAVTITDTYYIVTDQLAWPMLEIENHNYFIRTCRDLDGDGIDEIVETILDAEGNRYACVFMRKGDTIYRGTFDPGNLPDFDNYGPGAVWSEYDISRSLFRIHYAQKSSKDFAVLKTRDLSLFRFEVYRVIPEDIFAHITD